jgi:FkbM family methyltransferase
VEHEVTGGPGVSTGEELMPTMLANLRLSDGLLGENRQLACPQLRHDGEPLIQGHAHHARGGFRARATRDRPEMTASLIASSIGDAELVADDLVHERKARLHEILNGYEVKNVPDLAYWLYNDWRMTRWISAAYRAISTFRPVLWPLMDERVLRVIAEISSFDRLSEVAFYRTIRQLKPELGPVPLYENIWRFDAGAIGATELADGFEARKEPFKEQGKGGPPPERRISTILPLFRLATTELRYAQELRALIRPDVLEALSSGSELEALGRRGLRINFMWKVAAIALVMEGGWLPARIARSGIGSEITTGTELDASVDPTRDDVKAAASVPTRRFRLELPARQGGAQGDALDIEAPSTYWIPKELEAKGLSAYEPETLSCFLACVEASRPGVVLDIGANVGVFAWLAARLGGRKVIAFEPTPAVAACAVSIAEHNELAVEVEPIAVGGEPGTVPLYLSGASDLSNSTRAGFRQARGTVEVPMETLDAVCQRRAVEPAVLKIDTESTEPEVLRGAARVLATCRPWIICEVLGASTEARLQEILEPYGYVWFQITQENPLVARREIFGDRGGTYRNWLFAPSMPDDAFWQSMRQWRQALTRTRTLSTRTEVPAPALLFDSGNRDASEPGWAPRVAPGFEAAQRGESIAVSSTLEPGVRVYFFPGHRKRGEPDVARSRVEISPSKRYEVQFDVEAAPSEMPGVHLLAGQYDRKARIREQRLWVRPGTNVLAFDAHARASSLRLALRFSGPGKLTIGPIKLYRIEG